MQWYEVITWGRLGGRHASSIIRTINYVQSATPVSGGYLVGAIGKSFTSRGSAGYLMADYSDKSKLGLLETFTSHNLILEKLAVVKKTLDDIKIKRGGRSLVMEHLLLEIHSVEKDQVECLTKTYKVTLTMNGEPCMLMVISDEPDAAIEHVKRRCQIVKGAHFSLYFANITVTEC